MFLGSGKLGVGLSVSLRPWLKAQVAFGLISVCFFG